MCALFHAREQIRNTIAKRFLRSLSGFQIAYEHVAELGGLRAHAKDIAPHVNAFWQNRSFQLTSADYAMGGGFRSGLARLRDLGRVRRCAVMCAEAVVVAVPSSDHRGLSSSSVASRCFHILWAGQGRNSEPDAGVRPGPGGTVIYPPQVAEAGP